MKKIFTLLFISTILFSCSQENEINDISEPNSVDLATLVKQGKYDTSNLGIYKGVFTTLDGLNRATIQINFDGINNPTAEFLFPDNSKASLTANHSSKNKASGSTTSFSQGNFVFDFTVNEDGTNPLITAITYKGKDGGVLMAKETSKSAVEAKTGTYSCLDCSGHPDLGKGKEQSFNTMATTQNGMGNGAEFTIQLVLGVNMFSGTMSQSNCIDQGRGDITECKLNGTIIGGSGTAIITGKHLYDNENPTVLGDCSDLNGNFVYDSTHFGRSTMSFETDSPGNCF